jgi:hypothetical protein
MVEIDQDFEAGGDDLVRLSALDIGHKSDAARVVLVSRVIKSLRRGKIRQNVSLDGHRAGCSRNGRSKLGPYAKHMGLSIRRAQGSFSTARECRFHGR